MKKHKGLIIGIVILLTLVLSGSFIFRSFYNKQVVDFTYKYDRAVIRLPDDTIVEGKVESWTDYADGDQIQVKIDGVTYLVHSSCVALIND